MMEPTDPLDALAARFGVLSRYQDVHSRQCTVPPESVAAVLGALGVSAGAIADPAAALRALALGRSNGGLPAVSAVQAGLANWSLPVLLEAGTGRLRWTLTQENGSVDEGVVESADLASDGEAPTDASGRTARRLTLPVVLPAGYHSLELRRDAGGFGDGSGAARTLLIAAPRTCYRPPALQGDGRVWGPALQLYALRSERNWGIGDFGDLAEVIRQWGGKGASIIGLNPLHAMFGHNPRHASPYSPSSRQHLNTLYIDVEATEDFIHCEAARRLVRSASFQQRLATLRGLDEVDHAGVAAAKGEALRLLWAHFQAECQAPASSRLAEFRQFQQRGGRSLRLHATFEALQAHFHGADPGVWGWPVWPEAWRSPEAPEVAQFVIDHGAEIEYHEYLQWLADRQLERLKQYCSAQELGVGLYLDLAVSVDRAGSDVWANGDLFSFGATVGAPPDEVNPNGQGWGLPPLRPDALRGSGYRLFIDTLRATMRHAGAVRIDHVMGLMRLYWIPPDSSARDGAYVLYPLDELVAIVALESQRNQCMVVGEDLGTVADEMREAMARSELLSYRLFYFERDSTGAFMRPADYPRNALVAIGTHDLPTLAGWWSGNDLAIRRALRLFPSEAVYEEQLLGRAQDRLRLLLALQHAQLLPEGSAVGSAGADSLTPELVQAVHAHLAQAPSAVMMVQFEDVLGVVDQPNLPGTTDQHPNWRRKLPVSLDQLETDPRAVTVAALLAKARPRPGATGSARHRSAAIVPRATYRIQLHKDFGFDAAAAILPYLQRLGISHVYCSPIQQARPGSLHGYDVVAHDRINSELGGAEAFERFCSALEAHGMGQVLDMVPNHMGVQGGENAWWLDVLENGPLSRYARHFDIDWHPVNRELRGKVLLPVLGDHYGDVLASGDLVLGFDAERGSFSLHYNEHRFPLDPRTYALVLRPALEQLGAGDFWTDLNLLATAFARLPGSDDTGPDALILRRRDQLVFKKRLAALMRECEPVRRAVNAVLDELNVSPSRDQLHALHEAQSYRLAYWRVAADEINYRRFFDINALAALRIEEPAVFEATQGLALDLAAAGKVDGLRIDHPDGLRDPAQYFDRLQQGYLRRAWSFARDASALGAERPLYVVAEKIAAPHEDVPVGWSIHGTTGYRFAMVVGGLLVDTDAAPEFDRIWREFSGETRAFDELAYEGKREVMATALASELHVLATALQRIARADRRTRDYTFNTLRDALAEVTACMPVYRTYIVDRPSPQDLRYVEWAVAHGRRRSQAADLSVFDFVRRCMLNECPPPATAAQRELVRQFAHRFQQFCAPVAAKGVEDTAFYRYGRLASLNEVGGDPSVFGITPRAFHGASADRASRWPHTILATSTHDNKRAEDVRNRLHVLSESPARWEAALRRWHSQARGLGAAGATDRPAPADEYLLYQTVLGTLPDGGLAEDELPAYRARIEAYTLKASREAKRHTSWTRPNETYEAGLLGFVRGLLARVRPNPLLHDLQDEARMAAWFGAFNSLSTVLLKFTSPGVPDLYQGNELMDLSLVDPDNRRPVDYALRTCWLDELGAASQSPERLDELLSAMLTAPHDGRAKLWLTWRLLALRRERPELFSQGSYVPLAIDGTQQQHGVAFAREFGDTCLVVVAGRLFARLLGHDVGRLPLGGAAWGDTCVALPEVFQNVLLHDVLSGGSLRIEGGRLPLATAFRRFPGAAFLATRRS